MGKYPWWNKRARLLIMIKDKALEPTKGILENLEKEKIFNGVVVTEFVIKDNSTGDSGSSGSSGTSFTDESGNTTTSGMELQVVALDPYPAPGHSKQSFVARWKGSEYTSVVRPIFQEKIDNLRGNKLIACVFEFPPLVIKTEIAPGNYTYTGQEVRIFQEFATLLNFTYDFIEPPNGTKWGIDLGGNNWTGLIGETQRNADFGFASIFLLDNRERAVDVTNPYDQDQGCFAVPRPEALQNWVGLILPFSWQVWACIFAMAFVAGPIFAGITRPLRIDKSLTVGRGIFYAMGSLVSAQKAPQAKSHSLRTFIVVWLIFCWLAFILYRVALIVSLTTGPSSYKLDKISQLVSSGLEWGGFIEVLKTFTNTTERKKTDTKSEKSDQKMFDRFVEVTNITEALNRVALDGDFAVLDSGKYLQYASKSMFFDGYSSAIHVMKECPTRFNVGFAVPIGSPFLDRINKLISRFQSSGLIDKWLQDIYHMAALKIPNKERKRKRDRALSLDNMKLCYIIFFCGHFSAFLSLCVEKCITEYQARKGLLLRFARKISIISSQAMTPSFLITDTQPGEKNSLSEIDIQKEKHKEKLDKITRLEPPPDPDAIMPYEDEQEE
ncbi:ionotropic receptor 21a-like isoform X2 [Folsomia candida]|nr:ionotropic receptor 21a-like isoform X2 [Folsomia candida]